MFCATCFELNELDDRDVDAGFEAHSIGSPVASELEIAVDVL